MSLWTYYRKKQSLFQEPDNYAYAYFQNYFHEVIILFLNYGVITQLGCKN